MVMSMALSSWLLRKKEPEILPKQPLNEENQDNPSRLPRIDPIEVNPITIIFFLAFWFGYVRELQVSPPDQSA
ncbi:hypothetical protein OS493_031182 [Desmophyllum pertusum]|uniref:Uncharacterized protein n=1 Tax=Desmophyllum pertusum TaxID=174260 RepID=A0A9W9ZJX4_9CNID|nr:hypothetical protein OS493_031182 [Desmophyllum pertusum]